MGRQTMRNKKGPGATPGRKRRNQGGKVGNDAVAVNTWLSDWTVLGELIAHHPSWILRPDHRAMLRKIGARLLGELHAEQRP